MVMSFKSNELGQPTNEARIRMPTALNVTETGSTAAAAESAVNVPQVEGEGEGADADAGMPTVQALTDKARSLIAKSEAMADKARNIIDKPATSTTTAVPPQNDAPAKPAANDAANDAAKPAANDADADVDSDCTLSVDEEETEKPIGRTKTDIISQPVPSAVTVPAAVPVPVPVPVGQAAEGQVSTDKPKTTEEKSDGDKAKVSKDEDTHKNQAVAAKVPVSDPFKVSKDEDKHKNQAVAAKVPVSDPFTGQTDAGEAALKTPAVAQNVDGGSKEPDKGTVEENEKISLEPAATHDVIQSDEADKVEEAKIDATPANAKDEIPPETDAKMDEVLPEKKQETVPEINDEAEEDSPPVAKNKIHKLVKPKKRKSNTPVVDGNVFNPVPSRDLPQCILKTTKGLPHTVISDRTAKNFWREEFATEPFLKGWIMHYHKRPNPTNRHIDKYWFSPTGKKMRSTVEVNKFLNVLKTNNDEDAACYAATGKVQGSKTPTKRGRAPAAKKAKLETKPRGRSKSATPKATKVAKARGRSKSTTPKATKDVKPADQMDYSMTNAVQSAVAGARSAKKTHRKKASDNKFRSKAKDATWRQSAGAKARDRIRMKKIEAKGVPENTNGNSNSNSDILPSAQETRANGINNESGKIVAEPKSFSTTPMKKAAKKAAKKSIRSLPVAKVAVPEIAESKE
jgi:hypothetical protein